MIFSFLRRLLKSSKYRVYLDYCIWTRCHRRLAVRPTATRIFDIFPVRLFFTVVVYWTRTPRRLPREKSPLSPGTAVEIIIRVRVVARVPSRTSVEQPFDQTYFRYLFVFQIAMSSVAIRFPIINRLRRRFPDAGGSEVRKVRRLPSDYWRSCASPRWSGIWTTPTRSHYYRWTCRAFSSVFITPETLELFTSTPSFSRLNCNCSTPDETRSL